jgi:hypothetical protein
MIVVAAIAVLYLLREVTGLPVPVPELRRQVPEWWRTAFPPGAAAFLYGAGLGVGFLTYLRHGTLVAAAAAAVALGDPWSGALVLAPFGLARSIVVATVWRADTEDRLGEVVDAVERLGQRHVRRAANALALALLAGGALLAAPTAGDGFPPWVGTALLALIFGWAAVAKAWRSRAWEAALDGYALPVGVRAAARAVVPVTEATVAALLAAGEVRGGAIAALALLAVFSLAVLRARRLSGDALPCGCFGGRSVRSARRILARNAVLALVAVATIAGGGPLPALRPLGGTETFPAAVVIGGGILAVVLFGRAAALWSRRPHTG